MRSRWTYSTAMLSVSFIVGGLTLYQLKPLGPFLGKAGFTFGWLILLAAYYHYWLSLLWFHNKAHDIRERLCKLEDDLGIELYRIRVQRPTFWDSKILRMLWWVLKLLWRFFGQRKVRSSHARMPNSATTG